MTSSRMCSLKLPVPVLKPNQFLDICDSTSLSRSLKHARDSLRQSLSSGSVNNCTVDFHLENQVNKVTTKLYEPTVSKVTEQLFTQKYTWKQLTKVTALLPAVDNTKKIPFPHIQTMWPAEVNLKTQNALSSVNTLPMKNYHTHWPDILTCKAYFNFNSIFKVIAGKRHESPPCLGPPRLDRHQVLCLLYSFPSQNRL